MMNKLSAVIGDYEVFLSRVLQEVVEAGFDLADFVQLDHMCYRAPTLEKYEVKKREFSTVGKLLGEVQINGRPISTFRLQQPIYYDKWRVDTVELPAPREGLVLPEGLEHIEFVLYDDMQDFMKKYAAKNFDTKAIDRLVNPEIVFRLPSYSVKFHLLNLPTVVFLEQKLAMRDICDGR